VRVAGVVRGLGGRGGRLSNAERSQPIPVRRVTAVFICGLSEALALSAQLIGLLLSFHAAASSAVASARVRTARVITPPLQVRVLKNMAACVVRRRSGALLRLVRWASSGRAVGDRPYRVTPVFGGSNSAVLR